MIKRSGFILAISLSFVAIVAAAWFLSPAGGSPAEAALAEYQIEKMTCGSCVGKIEKALTGLDGVASVEVNLTSNRGRVTFDPAEIDSKVIAEMITNAGFPATLRMELAPQEYAALQQEQSQLGQQYLARIGDRLLARSDFEKLVQQRAPESITAEQNDQLWKAVWADVLQRELLLEAAEQNKVVIQDGEVDLKLDELRQGHKGLEQIVAERYGSMESFRERLREDMIINRTIEEHVYAGTRDPQQQQVKFQGWYAELQKNTEVIILDPRLKSLSQSGGGCACCNS